MARKDCECHIQSLSFSMQWQKPRPCQGNFSGVCGSTAVCCLLSAVAWLSFTLVPLNNPGGGRVSIQVWRGVHRMGDALFSNKEGEEES